MVGTLAVGAFSKQSGDAFPVPAYPIPVLFSTSRGDIVARSDAEPAVIGWRLWTG
jgi:hypothetical protein